MTAKHTPEPWRIKGDYWNDACVVTSDGTALIADCGIPSVIDRLNANRIVACVNFCAGIDNLSVGLVPRSEFDAKEHYWIEHANGIARERDALLAALNGCLVALECPDGDLLTAVEEARTAIAAIRSKA